jgi:acetate kinase
MLGVSGKTSDNQEIGRLAESGDKRAILCEEMYSHQIAKNVGAYMLAMGGADAIVFTGGIGENAGHYRAALGEQLAFLGVKIDAEKKPAAADAAAKPAVKADGAKPAAEKK